MGAVVSSMADVRLADCPHSCMSQRCCTSKMAYSGHELWLHPLSVEV
jgi:hypothetical protein